MAAALSALPITVARSWNEPADEAAQCLVSMSGSSKDLSGSNGHRRRRRGSDANSTIRGAAHSATNDHHVAADMMMADRSIAPHRLSDTGKGTVTITGKRPTALAPARSSPPAFRPATAAAAALAAPSAADVDAGTGAHLSPAPSRPRHSKPDRLSLACNPCRKRKVRCDAHQPECNNCARRGDVCVTSDPRRPGEPILARRKTSRGHTGTGTSRESFVAWQVGQAQEQQQRHQQSATQSNTRDESMSAADADVGAGADTRASPEERDNDDDDMYENDGIHHDDVNEPMGVDNSGEDNTVHDFQQLASPPIAGNLNLLPLEYLHRHGHQQQQRASQTSRSSQQRPQPGSVSTPGSQTSSNHRPSNGGGSGGNSELPSWVSRAYQEVSVEQGQSHEHHPTNSQHAQQHRSSSAEAPDDIVVVNTDGSPDRLKVLGASSLQCLFKFTDLCFAKYGFDATAPLFRHGMAQSDEFEMPLLLTLPDLPPRSVLSRCIDAFFARIDPLFPVVDRNAVESDASVFLRLQDDAQAARTGGLQSKVPSTRVPNLVSLYAIVCIGMNEMPLSDSALATCPVPQTTYLTACYGLHAHLTASPYLSSVQALFLLALSLRGCGKDGQTWYILGLAI